MGSNPAHGLARTQARCLTFGPPVSNEPGVPLETFDHDVLQNAAGLP
jgi:hypothetical protein